MTHPTFQKFIVEKAHALRLPLEQTLQDEFRYQDIMVEVPKDPALKVPRDYGAVVRYEMGFFVLVHPLAFSSMYTDYDQLMTQMREYIHKMRNPLIPGFINTRYNATKVLTDGTKQYQPLQVLVSLKADWEQKND